MSGQMSALIHGVVHIDRVNRCVVIRTGSATYPVVWPRGTSIAEDSIVMPDATTVRDGAIVEGGGGFLQLADVNHVVRASLEIPVACRAASGEVAVFNQHERVTTAAARP